MTAVLLVDMWGFASAEMWAGEMVVTTAERWVSYLVEKRVALMVPKMADAKESRWVEPLVEMKVLKQAALSAVTLGSKKVVVMVA